MENAIKFYFDDLSGEEFESYLKALFENLKYEVKLTPKSGDYGADLVIIKDNIKIVVQAKRYSDLVGIAAIQEAIGAISYYNANSGMVITNNYFTPNAIELAKSADIELWDRDILMKNIINSIGNTDNLKINDLPQIKLDNDIIRFFNDKFKNRELYLNINHKNPLLLGYNYDCELIIDDIKNINHLLVTGSINSGKSTFLYCIIFSIMNNPNSDIKFLLIDTKGLDFNDFSEIKNLIIPVVVEYKKSLVAFNWLLSEMINRYRILSEYHIKDINTYNEYAIINNLELFDKIIFIIDEISELYELNRQELLENISKITLKGGQVGIYLIIATRDYVISKTLERYFPSHAQMNKIESKYHSTIKIPYKDELNLYVPYLSQNDIEKIIFTLKKKWIADFQIKQSIIDERLDEYFEEVGMFIIEKDEVSIGMLQRAFRIGFNRAANIMDQLENYGIVEKGTSPRKILMSIDEFEILLNEIKF